MQKRFRRGACDSHRFFHSFQSLNSEKHSSAFLEKRAREFRFWPRALAEARHRSRRPFPVPRFPSWNAPVNPSVGVDCRRVAAAHDAIEFRGIRSAGEADPETALSSGAFVLILLALRVETPSVSVSRSTLRGLRKQPDSSSPQWICRRRLLLAWKSGHLKTVC